MLLCTDWCLNESILHQLLSMFQEFLTGKGKPNRLHRSSNPFAEKSRDGLEYL